MSWNTLYITGKVGFKEAVLERLENADLPIMPGNTGNEQDIILFWIDDIVSLRSFKKAIGGKIVFKYRLQFFNTLEHLQQFEGNKSLNTPREESMIREMNEWQNKQNYLHSA